MKSISAALAAHFDGNVTSIATAWKVTRRDGTVLGFTDHDVSKTIDGVRYVASSGYFRSAIANSATVAVDNLEVRGFLDNELISEIDLRNGAYDYAEVEIFAFNWKDLSQGIMRLRYGFFGEVTLRPSGLFVVELRGLMQLFSQTVGETIIPECRADLGDGRCGVPLLPDIRASSRTYAAGDRVIVPGEAINTSVNLALENAGFDWYETTNYFNEWKSTGGVIANFPHQGRTQEFYLRPTATAGFVQRLINYDPADVVNHSLGMWIYVTEPGWEISATVEFIYRTFGFLGGSITVLGTQNFPYEPVGFENVWYPRVWDIEGGYPPTTNCVRITVRWRANAVLLPTDYENIRISDISFTYGETTYEDGYQYFQTPPQVTTSMEVWSGNFLQTHPGNTNIMPYTGVGFLSANPWSGGGATQTVSVIDSGADATEIDAGHYAVQARIRSAGLDWGMRATVTLEFLNAINQTIGTATTGATDLKPAYEWHELRIDAAVPPLTRSIRVRLQAGLAPERTGVNTRVGFDSVQVTLYHGDSDTGNIEQFGRVEYVALNAGTTAAAQPGTFTHTIGEEIVDGSVTWECVTPRYTFVGNVGEVFSNTEFTVPEIDAPDDWFRWGVLTFLNGANRTRGVEVISWNNTTKRMTLMLPALSAIEPGTTTIRVHAGCDKSRDITGCKKYNNILNFRGEPEVPGTDQYFRVGGTGQ